MFQACARVQSARASAHAPPRRAPARGLHRVGVMPCCASSFGASTRVVTAPAFGLMDLVPAPTRGLRGQTTQAQPRCGAARPAPHRTLCCFGLDTTEVNRRLGAMGVRWPQVQMQCGAALAEVHVMLHAAPAHAADLEAAFAWAKVQLGSYAFATEDKRMAAVVLALLRQHTASLALAEACTGGLLADLLTDVAGCSDVLRGSVVAYDNAAKIALLRVAPHTLRTQGAVSQQAVIEMAQGARQAMPSTYGLAISGIAGPGGATSRKPVGTTWLALAWEGGAAAELLTLPYDRRRHKIWGAYHGLALLRRHLLSASPPPPESG